MGYRTPGGRKNRFDGKIPCFLLQLSCPVGGFEMSEHPKLLSEHSFLEGDWALWLYVLLVTVLWCGVFYEIATALF